jgi:uncharacterized membrane protein YadS
MPTVLLTRSRWRARRAAPAAAALVHRLLRTAGRCQQQRLALSYVLAESGGDLSRGFLMAAIAAIGMKTQWREVVNVDLKPILLMVGETIFLAALVLAMVRWAA